MYKIINLVLVAMDNIFDRVWQRKGAFLGTFFLTFTLTYLVFLAFDFLPEPLTKSGMPESEVVSEQSTTTEGASLESESATVIESMGPVGTPVKLVLKTLDREVSVHNPSSRTITDLDAALLEGVVRHPDSALPGEDGNVFVLGHSSYLPQVFNKNFQAFNGIQDLKWGDVIELHSDSNVYEYQVEKVYRARAQDVTVPIAGTGRMLTLATCNSFGSTDDRFIVEAKQVAVRAL